LRRLLLLTLILIVLFVCPLGAEEEKLLGEGSDGNRSSPVHLMERFGEDGKKISAKDETPKPFSTKKTCGECHDYEKIAGGWHFNAHNKDVQSGRPGQPWVFVNSAARTQIPMTARQWKNTFSPEQLGVSPWEFVKMNFSHFPGGGYGEMEADNPDEGIRQGISGMFEINCLACHNADPKQDQSEAAMQSARQNYRWLAAVSCQMGQISGVASSLDDFFDPEVDEGIKFNYKDGLFDKDDKVFFDIIDKPANKRCYFCHSDQDLNISENDEWTRNEDVHLASGMNCVDCHRNGADNMITRGTGNQEHGKILSCEGCHVGQCDAKKPQLGQLGAPKPVHRGIPLIHFEKLTCTACHSGPWPAEKVGRLRTAAIHKTGLHGKHNQELAQPHVYAPVMMTGADGKIGPHKIFWPAYWAMLKGDKVTPITPGDVLAKADSILDKDVKRRDDWKPLTTEQVADVLKLLADEDSKDAVPVYIAGGNLYRMDAKDKLEIIEHDSAKPYAWPMAHDVRPATQALGLPVRSCRDCHKTNSAFFFGKVQIDTPIKSESGPEYVEMIKLQGVDRLYIWAFNFSFVFRPFLKIVAVVFCCLIGLVILAYAVRAVTAISNTLVKREK